MEVDKTTSEERADTEGLLSPGGTLALAGLTRINSRSGTAGSKGI